MRFVVKDGVDFSVGERKGSILGGRNRFVESCGCILVWLRSYSRSCCSGSGCYDYFFFMVL